tara:strand:+ start:4043 stop:4375 length:333 start_codon:yes stop_codon:yes gene_type:complete
MDALKLECRHWGGALALAKKAKIPNGYISNYLSGKTKSINVATWERIKPHLSSLASGDKCHIKRDFSITKIIGVNHQHCEYAVIALTDDGRVIGMDPYGEWFNISSVDNY